MNGSGTLELFGRSYGPPGTLFLFNWISFDA